MKTARELKEWLQKVPDNYAIDLMIEHEREQFQFPMNDVALSSYSNKAIIIHEWEGAISRRVKISIWYSAIHDEIIEITDEKLQFLFLSSAMLFKYTLGASFIEYLGDL